MMQVLPLPLSSGGHELLSQLLEYNPDRSVPSWCWCYPHHSQIILCVNIAGEYLPSRHWSTPTSLAPSLFLLPLVEILDPESWTKYLWSFLFNWETCTLNAESLIDSGLILNPKSQSKHPWTFLLNWEIVLDPLVKIGNYTRILNPSFICETVKLCED